MNSLRSVRCLLVSISLFVWSAVAVAATADLVDEPDSELQDGDFSDNNGSLEEEVGGESTWAEVRGDLHAEDPNETKSAAGGAIDKMICLGDIDNADVPAWVVQLDTRMGLFSEGYQSISYEGELDGTARGVIAIYGNFTGSPIKQAKEVKTSTTVGVGNYDIWVTIDGNSYEFDNGGECKRPSNPLATRSVSAELLFDEVQFGRPDEVIEFTYESQTSGSMGIEFTEAGEEWVAFSVDQDDDGEHGQWIGAALAWDMITPEPVLIDTFLLG